MTKDPVCGMDVDKQTAPDETEYEGRTYVFCSSSCRTTFDAEPARYASSAEPVPTRS